MKKVLAISGGMMGSIGVVIKERDMYNDFVLFQRDEMTKQDYLVAYYKDHLMEIDPEFEQAIIQAKKELKKLGKKPNTASCM